MSRTTGLTPLRYPQKRRQLPLLQAPASPRFYGPPTLPCRKVVNLDFLRVHWHPMKVKKRTTSLFLWSSPTSPPSSYHHLPSSSNARFSLNPLFNLHLSVLAPIFKSKEKSSDLMKVFKYHEKLRKLWISSNLHVNIYRSISTCKIDISISSNLVKIFKSTCLHIFKSCFYLKIEQQQQQQQQQLQQQQQQQQQRRK